MKMLITQRKNSLCSPIQVAKLTNMMETEWRVGRLQKGGDFFFLNKGSVPYTNHWLKEEN